MDEREETVKTAAIALPDSRDKIVQLISRMLDLPKVQEISIRTDGVFLKRAVAENEAVLPPEDVQEDVTPEIMNDLLARLEDNGLVFHQKLEERIHPYIDLIRAYRKVESRKLSVTHIVTQPGGWVQAFLGLESTDNERIFGAEVLEIDSDLLEDKIVVLGCPLPTVASCVYAVVLNIGD